MHDFAAASGPPTSATEGRTPCRKAGAHDVLRAVAGRAPGFDSEVVERERARLCWEIVVVKVGHPARAIRARCAGRTVEVGRDHSPSDGRPRLRRLLRLRLLWWLAMWLLRRLMRVGLHSIVEARKSGVGLIFKQRRPQTCGATRRARRLSVAPAEILSRPLQQRCPPTPPPPPRRRSTPRRGT